MLLKKDRCIINEIKKTRIRQEKKQDILKILTLNEKMFSFLNKGSNEDLKEKINNKKIFNKDHYLKEMGNIKNLILNKGKDFKKINRQEDDYILANLSASYIAMNTGRRSYEIFKTLDLIKNGKTTFYKGLTKKKDEEKKEAKYKAYILDDDYKTLKLALKYIRKYYSKTFETLDNKKFNQNYATNINKFLKNQVLNDFDEKINYSTIRDMYSNIAIELFKPEEMDEELFRNIVLSHELENTTLGLSAHYRKSAVKKK